MSRSFDRLIDFFSMEQREKEKKVEEIFEETLEFFKYFKHIQAEGSDEEKKNVQEKLASLQEKFKSEAEKTLSDIKLTENQVKEITSKEKNFSSEQWAFLKNVENVFNTQKQALVKEKAKIKQSTINKLKRVKKVKARFSNKNWLKS